MKGQGAIGTPASHKLDPKKELAVNDWTDDLSEITKLNAATKGTAGSGDVHVDLDQMVEFYNTLSTLREMLRGYADTMTESGIGLHATFAGGAVPGVREAWVAIGESVGVTPGGASLQGNVQSLDKLLASHMAAIAHNVQQYAAQDNKTVFALDKAAKGDQ